MRTKKNTDFKLYVGTYRKYNNGSIAGGWLTLNEFADVDEFIEKCKEIHSDEEDPELMFQDSEELPDRFFTESSVSPLFWELDDYADLDAIGEYMDWRGISADEFDISDFEDSFNGYYDSKEEFAEQLLDECGDLSSIPESLRYYFDYEKFARDLFMSDYYFSNGYVFRHC